MSNDKQQPQPENPNNQFSNTEPLTHAQRVAIANKMSNNRQSSIELFIDQLEEKGKAYEETVGVRTVNICIDVSEYMELKQQARAMHKEETLKLYYAYEDYVLREEGIIKTFGQFYNETFNNNEQQ